MLRIQTLSEVLSQANTNGIHSTMLLTRNGHVLVYAGYAENNSFTASTAADLWNKFQNGGSISLNGDRLQMVLTDYTEGRVAIVQVANVLLCMCGDQTVELGLLKLKITALSSYLDGPLKQLSSPLL